jgi:hypothetical protein
MWMEVLLPILWALSSVTTPAAIIIYLVHCFDQPRLAPPIEPENEPTE